MQKKIYIAICAIVLAVLGGYVFWQKKNAGPDQPSAPSVAVQERQPAANKSSDLFVLYTNAGYSPAVLKVKNGDTVTFRNVSSQLMWTSSDPHPVHSAYPVRGGCVASAFDECGAVGAGADWSFQFTVAGTWKYHNHLNPRDAGMVIAE